MRNLERALIDNVPAIRVFDRTDVILDIFAQRAKTAEGKLQVELARLEHLYTRLVKGWTHLERQRGSLDEEQADHAPPDRRTRSEHQARQRRHVERRAPHARSRAVSLTGTPRGQNQPVSVMSSSTAPSVTPQAVKIATITPMPEASAVSSGHMLGPSSTWR